MNNEPPASGARGPFNADLRHAAGVVPVGPALPDSLAPLGGLLHEILARAGCNRLATAQRADDRLLDRMAAASKAAQDIELPGGHRLASRLWTSLASFSDGTMADALREGRARSLITRPDGFKFSDTSLGRLVPRLLQAVSDGLQPPG